MTSIVGIDLGTTYSCVAVWLPEWQRVEVVANDQGNRTMPSCVAFTKAERLLGESAINQATRNPQNTIHQVKRLVGRSFDDAIIQQNINIWPFKVVRGHGDKPVIQVEWKGEKISFYPEEISGMILGKMKDIAEMKLGKGTVQKAVVTVPAYFNNSQRQATKDAGTIAGLDVVRIINEPTAAAFAYGLDESLKNRGKRCVLVFDLGGGTFDVSILEIEGKDFTVRATGGDTSLGGEDFDNRLLKYLVDEFKTKHNVDILSDIRATSRLRIQCERAKRELSFQKTTTIDIDALYEGIDFVATISRVRLENLLKDYFAKCMDIVKSVVADANLTKSDIHDVILVGGSSRIPKMQEMLSEYFDDKELCKAINPDEAVAYGAAIQGAVLSESSGDIIQNIVIQDVTPLTLGVPGPGDLMAVIVPRNTPIPCSIQKVRNTLKDGQTTMRLDIYQGERSMVRDNQLLGRFRLHGLQPAPKGVTKATLKFEIDEDGILTVSAQENDRDNKGKITLTGEQLALQAHEIQNMLEAAEKYRKQDEEERRRVLCRIELDDMLYNLENLSFDIENLWVRNQVLEVVREEQEWINAHEHASRYDLEQKLEKIRSYISHHGEELIE